MLTSGSGHMGTVGRDTVYSRMGVSRYEDERIETPKKLKARDGHTAHVVGGEMLIFGGDRHMIALNDVVLINLTVIAPHLTSGYGFKLPVGNNMPVYDIQAAGK